MRTLIAAAALFIALAASAQQLTVDWIMRDPELLGYAPKNVRWSPDSRRVYFEWKERTRPIQIRCHHPQQTSFFVNVAFAVT